MSESGAELTVCAHVVVSGRVQGVGYRGFAARSAAKRGLSGGVRNLADGRVELDVEGTRAAIESFLHDLEAGPSAAHVTKIETKWSAATKQLSNFSIWY